MNDTPGRHLTEEQLLGFLDHELPRREFGGAREHLSTCWKCQTDLTELRETIAEFVRYQQKTSQLEANPGSDSWPDLRRRMRDVVTAAEVNRRTPGPGFRWGMFARYALAGVVIASLALAAIVVIRRDSPTPVQPLVPSRTEAVPNTTASSAPTSMIPPPGAKAAFPPLPVATPGGVRAEVGALMTLHELEADLGEPVRVESRPDGRVSVTGSGLSHDREVEITTALRNRPEIAVRFDQPVSSSVNPAVAAKVRSVNASSTTLNAVLEPVLGGPSEVEGFANSVVDESEEMMARAYALHNLALRFPSDGRSSLNPDERAAVARIESDHRAQLTLHAQRLGRLLETVKKVAGDNDTIAATPHAGLFDSARRLDQAVNRAFGGETGSVPLPQLLSEMLAASRQLDSAILASQ